MVLSSWNNWDEVARAVTRQPVSLLSLNFWGSTPAASLCLGEILPYMACRMAVFFSTGGKIFRETFSLAYH